MARRLSLYAGIALATFILALLAGTQLRSQPLTSSNRYARDQALRGSVDELENQNRQLKARVKQLTDGVKALEDQAAQRSGTALSAKAAIDAERAAVGLTALHGPGLTVTVHDGKDPNDPSDHSLGWIIHYQDLQDIVNLMWASGAEAVSVNGQRVVPTSSFFYAGVNVLINNGTRLSSPYTITALGLPSGLDGGISNRDQLTELKSRSRVYDLGLNWQRSTRLQVPAYDASFLLKYAQPAS